MQNEPTYTKRDQIIDGIAIAVLAPMLYAGWLLVAAIDLGAQ